MESFLDKYYKLVDEWIGDPHTSKRLTRRHKYRDLETVEGMIWERLCRACGQESLISRQEYEFDIEADKEFYPLPGNFRLFIECFRRDDSDPNLIIGRLGTVPFWSKDQGLEILSSEQGFRIQPTPTEDSAGWTMVYLKGPVLLHQATAPRVTASSITMGTPDDTDGGYGGTRIDLPDYLSSSMIRVYEADRGAGQIRPVLHQAHDAGTLIVRHPFDPVPTGTVKYEIRPVLPPRLDEIYAIAAAMKYVSRRTQPDKYAMASESFKNLWDACLAYFTNTTTDRAPRRMPPDEGDIQDVYLQDVFV